MVNTIKDLLRDERANVNVVVSLADLRELVNELVENRTAKYLGVTKPILHRWNKLGYLTCIKVGSKVRYRREDIEAFSVK